MFDLLITLYKKNNFLPPMKFVILTLAVFCGIVVAEEGEKKAEKENLPYNGAFNRD